MTLERLAKVVVAALPPPIREQGAREGVGGWTCLLGTSLRMLGSWVEIQILQADEGTNCTVSGVPWARGRTARVKGV